MVGRAVADDLCGGFHGGAFAGGPATAAQALAGAFFGDEFYDFRGL